MPIFRYNGQKISYEDYGSGLIILLIHGSPGNARSWEQVGKRLADRFRVISPDLPGYGETSLQPAGEPPEVGYASRLIERLIGQVGVPFVLAGHSYGGVVALNLALHGGVPLGGMVLVEPVALKILSLVGESEAFAKAKDVFDNYITSFEKGNRRAVQKMVDFWFGTGAFDHLPSQLTAYLVEETASNIRDVRATFNESYSSDTFQRLRIPVEVIIGDHSPDITLRIGQALVDQLWAGRLWKLKNADHALITTHIDALVRIIEGITAADNSY